MSVDQCEFPYCRNDAIYNYIGVCICHKHWAEIADCNSPENESKILAKIGLMRNENGSVVERHPHKE